MSQEMAAMLTERIVESVRHYENFKIPIGVSNRHVHVSRADLEMLPFVGRKLLGVCQKLGYFRDGDK